MSKKNETLIITTALALEFAEKCRLPDESRKPSQELVDRLAAVNGRATSFTTCADSVVEIALRTEMQLDLSGVSKAYRVGVEVDHTGRGPTAASYKNSVKTTEITMRRKAAGWFLISVSERKTYPKQNEKLLIAIHPSHADRICTAALKPFTIVEDSKKQPIAA